MTAPGCIFSPSKARFETKLKRQASTFLMVAPSIRAALGLGMHGNKVLKRWVQTHAHLIAQPT